MMNTLTIELPVDGHPSAAELPDNLSHEARLLLAVKPFEQGRISSGKAGLRCCNSRNSPNPMARRALEPVTRRPRLSSACWHTRS